MNRSLLIFFAGICSVGMVFFSDGAARPQKTILLIQSYHPGLAWTAQCEKGIRSATGDTCQLQVFYMDTKRLPGSEFQARADLAWLTVQETDPDLVMIGDDNGLRLLGGVLAAARIPTVYFGINNNPRNYFKTLPDTMTGVLEYLPVFPWLRYLGKIMPGAKKALVLMDSSPTTDSVLEVSFHNRQQVTVNAITAEYRIARSWGEWKQVVQGAGIYDMIVMPTFHALKDEAGSHIPVETVVEWTSVNSTVPVFSLQDYTVHRDGTAGAYVVNGEVHGRLAGEIAVQILIKGRSPRDILPIRDQNGKFYFNLEQLDRFKLILPEAIRAEAVFQ